MLEHRWSQRLATEPESVILTVGNDSIPAVLGNASLGGLYLETQAKLTKNAAVQILLRVAYGRHAEWRRLQAVVVHRSDRGVGVLVDISKPQALQALKVLLQQCQEGSPSGQSPLVTATRRQENQISNA